MAKKKKLLLPLLMAISCSLLVTVVAMRFGLAPRTASIFGGAAGAAVAAMAVARGGW